MKRIITTILFFVLTQTSFAKIYDAFMCYTQVDMVVLFGVLKPQGTLRINYHRLDQNPTTIDLKVSRYRRSDNSIQAKGLYNGKSVINIKSKGGLGTADIDLTSFPGAEDVSFQNEEVICYFGKFEDK